MGATVRVITTKTLLDQYATTEYTKNYANAKIRDVNFSFSPEFGITLKPVYTILTSKDFPSDYCPLSPRSTCTSSCASVVSDRHKHHTKNLNWVHNYSFQNNDFIVVMQGNVLNGGVMGVIEFVGGRRVVTAFPTSSSAILDSRILQHEMSHAYRVYDPTSSAPCTGRCIMSGGFDLISISYTTDIWCSTHYNQFRPR